MSHDDIFSSHKDSIKIIGVDNLVRFTRYNPRKPDSFLDGTILGDDLITGSAAKLYTKGTPLTFQRLARIVKISESTSFSSLVFNLKRTEPLFQQIRSELKARIDCMFEQRKETGIFDELLHIIGDDFESFVDEILSEDYVTVALYKMKFVSDSSQSEKSVLFFNQSVNVALLTVAIASSSQFVVVPNKKKEKLIELFKAGLFHNYGTVTAIDRLYSFVEEKHFRKYWEGNRLGIETLRKLGLSDHCLGAIHNLSNYHTSSRNLKSKKDWPANMAKVMLVVEMYLRDEIGLLGKSLEIRDVVDLLNVMMMEGELHANSVQALTIGLGFQDLHDFYAEIDRLKEKCPYGVYGEPYPMTGYKSPTLFICVKEMLDCDHIETSLYAVKVIKGTPTVPCGKYRRCWLMTRLLNAFYRTNYRDIKKTKASDCAECTE